MTWKPLHPVIRAGAGGALAGLAAAALLLCFARQPVGDDYLLADAIAAWAGVPANHWLHELSGWRWGWDASQRAPFLLLSLTLNGGLWGMALATVVQRWTESRRFRRTAVTCAAITAVLAAAQWVVKLPGPMGGGGALQAAVFAAHVPGVFLPERVGLCCGYFGSTVLRDWGSAEGYRPDALALGLLFASNFIMYVVLAYPGRALWRRVSRWRDPARAAVPVTRE